jgi:hypothetical protein
MGTLTRNQPTDGINLSELAAKYESNQNLKRIVKDICKHSPVLARMLEGCGEKTLSKTQFIDLLNEWKLSVGEPGA